LFSGIFIVVMGGLADRVGFLLSIAGSLLVAITPAGGLAAPVMLRCRACRRPASCRPALRW